MITGLIHLHSAFRYFVVIFLVMAIVDAFMGHAGGKEYTKKSKLLGLLTLIFTHTQALVGLLLYFLGSKGLYAIQNVDGFMAEPPLRFFAVEHVTGMLIAITLITIGYSKAKKETESKAKFARIRLFFTIGFLVMFFSIPWPFLKEFGKWF